MEAISDLGTDYCSDSDNFGHCLRWVGYDSNLFHRGWIQLEVYLSNRSLASNERLKCKILINNQSSRNIKYTRMILNQDVILKNVYGVPGKLLRSIQSELYGQSIPAFTSVIREETFNAPERIQPTFSLAHTQIRHHVLVEIHASNWRRQDKVILDGCIPIRFKDPCNSLMLEINTILPPTYYQIQHEYELPTYEEATQNSFN